MSIKQFAAGVLVAGALLPAAAFAQTTTSSSAIQTLLNQIAALQQQIVSLQQQQAQAFASLSADLRQGSTGDQVTALQQMLAMDPSIYPEKQITGFFGRLTAQAVKRFQKKYGISQVGNVGPMTRAKLNEIFAHMGSSTVNGHKENDNDNEQGGEHGQGSCLPGHLTAPGWLKNFGPLGDKIFKGMSGCNGTGTTTPPVVDTTAPVISNVATSGISNTSATITWTTNENATGQIEYGTTTSYGNTTTLNSTLGISHSVTITGLTASTVYHFRVDSKDASNNLAQSSDVTFTTAATPDTTPPQISGITSSSITSSGATIQWTTDEVATSQVDYGTTSLYGNSTALDTTLLTNHSVSLTGLAPLTTYHFRIDSKDAANNLAQSTDVTFTTIAAADVTPPVISAVTLTPATTTALVTWTTNEPSTEKVYFGTANPLDLTTAASASDAALSTSHSLNLTGLSASTTYYYVVESKDAANNTATTSQSSFVTNG